VAARAQQSTGSDAESDDEEMSDVHDGSEVRIYGQPTRLVEG